MRVRRIVSLHGEWVGWAFVEAFSGQAFLDLLRRGVSQVVFPEIKDPFFLHFFEPPDSISDLEPGECGSWGTSGAGVSDEFSDKGGKAEHDREAGAISLVGAQEHMMDRSDRTQSGSNVLSGKGKGRRMGSLDTRISPILPIPDEWVDPSGAAFRRCVFPTRLPQESMNLFFLPFGAMRGILA